LAEVCLVATKQNYRRLLVDNGFSPPTHLLHIGIESLVPQIDSQTPHNCCIKYPPYCSTNYWMNNFADYVPKHSKNYKLEIVGIQHKIILALNSRYHVLIRCKYHQIYKIYAAFTAFTGYIAKSHLPKFT